MTRTVIGANVALRYLKAYDKHVSYWHELNPTVMLAYVDKPDHAPYILEYAAEFPNALVVARIQHPLDGGFHLAPTGENDTREYVASPTDYHNQFGFLGQQENIILNVLNEPSGFADDVTLYRLVRWMTEYIPLAAKAKTKSLLFNWADRNPKIINGLLDGRFDDVLTMMAHYPELFYMGLHFYGPDPIADVIKGYVARCDKLSIKPPKVIGSEFGIDSTGGAMRGYKTWPEYQDGGNYARWEIAQVRGDLVPYFESGVLIGLANFQEGNSGGWNDFDTENDQAYKSEIKRAALAGELDMQPTPPTLLVTKKDIVYGQKYRIGTPGQIINAYAAPSISDRRLGTIPDAAVVEVGNKVTVDRETWLQVRYPAFSGWGWIKVDLVDLRETVTVPVVVVPPEVPETKQDEPPAAEQPKQTIDVRSREAKIVEQLKILRGAIDALISLYETQPITT